MTGSGGYGTRPLTQGVDLPPAQVFQEGVRVQEMSVGSGSQRSHLFKRVLFGGSRFNQSFRALAHV